MIEAELPNGTILEFPDGTDQNIIQAAVKKQLGIAEQPVEPPATQPIEQPVEREQPGVVGLAGEVAAGFNRSLLGLADFLTTDQFNAIAEIVGSDIRAPSLAETFVPERGALGGEGLLGQIAGTAGELAGTALTAGQAFRGLAQRLPAATAGEGVGTGIIRQLGVGAPAQEAALGAVSGVGTEIGEEVGGVPGAVVGGVVSPLIAAGVGSKIFNYGKLTPKQRRIRQDLIDNPRDPDLSKYLLVEGKPEVSAKLKNAANMFGGRSGDEFVAVAKNASPVDKKAVKDMLGIIRRGMKDPVFRDANRAGQVVGESLTRRVKALRGINSQAGNKIDQIAREQLNGQRVDLTFARDRFKQSMDDLRVAYDPDTGRVSFAGSALEGGGAGASRDLIKRLAIRLRDPDFDAADAHFIKRLIDKEVTFGKSPGGLAGDIDDSIKGLRKDVNDSIRDISEPYKNANIKYKESIDAINNLQSAAGGKVDLSNEKALGVSLRRLTNNTQARANLEESLKEIDDVASRYGVNFKDDIFIQNYFANALEKRFKLAGDTSLEGIGTRAAQAAQKSKLQHGLEITGQAVDKLTGVTDEKTIKALMEIL